MVFVREIKKGGKVYRYLYKSKRIGGKVKSIYVGREEVKHPHSVSKKVKHKVPKKISSKLTDITEQFNTSFDEIQKISYDFVGEIDKNKLDKFEDFFEKYHSQIRQFNEKIPSLNREIRKFGIY